MRNFLVTRGLGAGLTITDGYGATGSSYNGTGLLTNQAALIDGSARMFTMHGDGELVNKMPSFDGRGYVSISVQFTGSDIISVDEQMLYIPPSASIYRSKKDGAWYQNAYDRVDNKTEYIKERKIVLKIRPNVDQALVSAKKPKTVYVMSAIYDDVQNTIFIDKKSSFDSAFFSNMVGKRNYIFILDANRKVMTANVLTELEKGKTKLNQVKFPK